MVDGGVKPSTIQIGYQRLKTEQSTWGKVKYWKFYKRRLTRLLELLILRNIIVEYTWLQWQHFVEKKEYWKIY